jgi:UPF0148 protein
MSQASKKLAKMLMEGAKLRAEACPVCSTPLVELKTGEVYCVNCEKRVLIVSDDKQVFEESSLPAVLDDLQRVVARKVGELTEKLSQNTTVKVEDLQVIESLLEILKRVKNLDEVRDHRQT